MIYFLRWKERKNRLCVCGVSRRVAGLVLVSFQFSSTDNNHSPLEQHFRLNYFGPVNGSKASHLPIMNHVQ